MIANLILGCATTASCLTIQCVVLTLVLRLLIKLEHRSLLKHSFPHLAAVLMAALMITLGGNLIQIALWAELFCLCGEFEFSRQRFTTRRSTSARLDMAIT